MRKNMTKSSPKHLQIGPVWFGGDLFYRWHGGQLHERNCELLRPERVAQPGM
jgi:hypothetical protein